MKHLSQSHAIIHYAIFDKLQYLVEITCIFNVIVCTKFLSINGIDILGIQR